MTAAPGRDRAERILGGPVLWVGLAALTLFAVAPFGWVFLLLRLEPVRVRLRSLRNW